MKLMHIELFKMITIVILIQMLFILPWALRSFAYDGKIRFTAANGGGTLYTSLGQLPGNPWKLEGDDPDAYRFAETHNKKGEFVAPSVISPSDKDYYGLYTYPKKHQYKINFYPFGHEGDDLLKKEFVRLARQYPGAFAKKVLFNFVEIFRYGVYVAEFDKFGTITENNDVKYFQSLNKIEKIRYLLHPFDAKNNPKVAGMYFVNFVIFAMFFSFLLVYFLFSFLIHKRIPQKIFYILLPIVIFKILLVSFIQYSPRFMNDIYLFLLGYFLVMMELKRDRADNKPI
jgi:hypothetical protein